MEHPRLSLFPPAVLILILWSGCVILPSDKIAGCWETNPKGEGLAMHFNADGGYFYPVQTGKQDRSGGRMILINRNSMGNWERINETAVRVNYQTTAPFTGEEIVIIDTVIFDDSGNSAYFESIGLDEGMFYRTNRSCN